MEVDIVQKVLWTVGAVGRQLQLPGMAAWLCHECWPCGNSLLSLRSILGEQRLSTEKTRLEDESSFPPLASEGSGLGVPAKSIPTKM